MTTARLKERIIKGLDSLLNAPVNANTLTALRFKIHQLLNYPFDRIYDIKFALEVDKTDPTKVVITPKNIHTAALLMGKYISPADIIDQDKHSFELGTFVRGANGEILLAGNVVMQKARVK